MNVPPISLTAEMQEKIFNSEDFENFKCGKCKEYLRSFPLNYITERDEYVECASCFNKDENVAQGHKTIQLKNLECLAHTLRFPCRNYRVGCRERRYDLQIKGHEQECPFRNLICPLCSTFNGLFNDLLNHLRSNHLDLFLPERKLQLSFSKSFDKCYIVQQHYLFFLFRVRLDLIGKEISFGVNLSDNNRFKDFNIKISSQGNDQIISAKQKINFGCVKLDTDGIQRLCNTCPVFCEVSVRGALDPDTTKQLLSELECGICREYMLDQIILCTTGHNFCKLCTRSLSECPLCKGEILKTRNLGLEKIIANGYFPCINSAKGCDYLSLLEEMLIHYSDCIYSK
ncbi:hypothetical protein FQA39_LY08949 [Lamprigera yunnana]|nr:hypothetical protein FQA39_LY08949 [Lamprigera yunnana]